jgi:hypothetical protein
MSVNLKVVDLVEVQSEEDTATVDEGGASHSLKQPGSWTLPKFRAGDLVEVRGKEEILATLDERGCVDGLPFMPEMLAFCGKQLVVEAIAHKTCDTARQMGTARRLNDTLHLRGSRCDGSAHGGCEAECLLFWKAAWVKPVSEKRQSVPVTPKASSEITATPEILQRATRVRGSTDPVLYSCQATQLCDASAPLPWWDLRQYFLDVTTGNRTLGQTLRVTFLASLRAIARRVPFGYRAFTALTEATHRMLTGHGVPRFNGQVPDGQQTPTINLGLQPGELVRIRSLTEIEQTLNSRSKNRGLYFDPSEMAQQCGRVARVRRRVTKIIEEPTGKMMQMTGACVVLDNVYCQSENSRCRLNCPRAIYSYWRESWLERVPSAPE